MELGLPVHSNCYRMKYDVVIIGGGIAGLPLSIDLKKRGYHVAAVEKGNYPRHKVCGEYISMESYNYLLGICPALTELKLPIISNFKLTSGNNKEFTTKLDLGGFGISRYLLEDLLFKEAEKLGVVFMLNTKAHEISYEGEEYVVKTNKGDITARLLCNATGRKSNLKTPNKTEANKGPNYVGVKYHVKLPRNTDLIEIHNFPGGYCGISNVEDDKACLCYIVNSKYLNKVNNSIPQLEKAYLFKNKSLKKIFTTAEFVFTEPVTVSGINFLIKEPVTDDSFYLGDAAGSMAPIIGNGMSMGLRSASALANTIDQYLSSKITKPALVANYKDFWRKEFSARIKLSRYLQKLSEYSFLTKRTIDIFNVFPALAKGVIKQTHGKPF
ncbi:MAG TPA: NAD(P)/FAD-dependent oxidoreductase [Bacteroidia bacterium]|nr:NAD(P)/FAD-dependent oxidoreductase [Bacteroidia bacterium]